MSSYLGSMEDYDFDGMMVDGSYNYFLFREISNVLENDFLQHHPTHNPECPEEDKENNPPPTDDNMVEFEVAPLPNLPLFVVDDDVASHWSGEDLFDYEWPARQEEADLAGRYLLEAALERVLGVRRRLLDLDADVELLEE